MKLCTHIHIYRCTHKHSEVGHVSYTKLEHGDLPILAPLDNGIQPPQSKLVSDWPTAPPLPGIKKASHHRPGQTRNRGCGKAQARPVPLAV